MSVRIVTKESTAVFSVCVITGGCNGLSHSIVMC